MHSRLARFLIHWISTSLAMYVASLLFSGIRFADGRALIVAALLLGLVNAVVRPLLVILTLPITVLTLGLFLLVINALMLLLVSWLVGGFVVAGFGTALLASLLISFVSYVIGAMLGARPR